MIALATIAAAGERIAQSAGDRLAEVAR